MKIEPNRPLSQLCTFGIGGPARFLVDVTSIEQMRQALRYAKEESLNYLVIGKGSNCLFDDQGYDGLVIVNKIGFLEELSAGQFYVGAGYSFSRLGALTARKGWSGLEFASGIPGSVGGAVYMNAGANSHDTSETLVAAEVLSPDGELKRHERAEMSFGYRTSSFQRIPGAIVSATFRLTPSTEARKVQVEIVKYRQATQPYSDLSAGCIFRNPPAQSAGALIDKAGLKGLRVGGAMVSERHANFIVNTEDARASDVIALMALVRQRVLEATGVQLQSEVVHIPYQRANQGSLHD